MAGFVILDAGFVAIKRECGRGARAGFAKSHSIGADFSVWLWV